MSERMNKERAIEQIKKLIKFTKKAREVIGTPQKDIEIVIGENQFYLSDELLQALDIAIDSLDNEWVDAEDRLPSEDKDYFVTIESTIDFRKRYYIVLAHWEKSYTDKSVDGWWYCVGWNRAEEQHLYDITNDVVAWKKVEPYERKGQV